MFAELKYLFSHYSWDGEKKTTNSQIHPWEDPRRPSHDREAWRRAKPKSLKEKE